MVKRTMLAALTVATVGLIGAVPADAQDYPGWRFDVGVNGGLSGYTAMLDDDHLGEDTEDIRFESGWLLGSQLTFWVTPRFGIRANGTYTERPVASGGFFSAGDPEMVNDNNLWTASGDLMFRPLAGGYDLFNRHTLPFIALGVGGHYSDQPGEYVLNTWDTEDEWVRGQYFLTPDGQTFAIAEEWKLMGLAAVGTDVRLSDNFGLRLELGDRFFDAPLRTDDELATNPEEDVGNVVHQLYAQIGAHMLFGLEAPEVVAVAPAPPAPPARPRPEPEPEPVEERIRVCVIDPAAGSGVRMIDAIYLPETRDTMVVVNGARRPISATLPRVMLANEADWFVRGEPLALTLAEDYTLEYTTWRSGVMIEADQLAYLGTVRGLPVYAADDDVQDVIEEINELRRAQRSDDLSAILEQREDLHEDIEDIQYLYVPLQPTGCIFQTVQLVPQVRKKDSN